ncbi:MAG: hypothetical protein AAFY53_04680 [Pseudomonadota bacterium]
MTQPSFLQRANHKHRLSCRAQLMLAAIGAAVVVSASAIPATAQPAFTGGEAGAYHSHFCPALASALKRRNVDLSCRPSNGTADNMGRVANDPRAFGYGQLDVFALKANAYGGRQVFKRVRSDDVRECVFAVTKEKDIRKYGELAVFASQLNFFLPPDTSGSTNTFRYLQEIDPNGLGQAQDVFIAKSTESAIQRALETPGGVAFFVQFPDPNNARFRLVQDLGGHMVPIVDRVILSQTVDGQPIYFAQETQVTNARWLRSGRKVITACTPLVVFTGAEEAIADARARREHGARIDIVQRLRPQELLPRAPLFARLIKRTKQLSSSGVARLTDLSEKARERARPMLERAKQAGTRLYERAKEGAEIMIEKAKPQPAAQ